MKKKGENLQDIYRTPKACEENPDYLRNMPPELEDKLRYHRIQSSLLGLFCLVLLFILTVLLVREPRIEPTPLNSITIVDTQYIPRHTLPLDDLWVMSYPHAGGSLSPKELRRDKPISTKWIKNAAYHVIMGQQALTIKQYEEATAHLEKVLVIFPEIHDVCESLGAAYLHQQKFEAAIAPLKKALKEKETFSIISNLGIALFATQQLEASEPFLLRALALQPEHPGCHKNLALLYQEMERPKQASFHFENYFSLSPDDFNALENYSEYLLHLGQRERATAFLREACEQESTDALPLYLLLAIVEARATNAVQSVEALQNITRYISPNMALTQLHMEEFDTIRDTEVFQDLLHQIELAEVTLENQID